MGKPDIEPAYTLEEFAAIIRVKKSTALALAKQGKIPAIRVGKNFIVPRPLAQRFLNGEWQPTGQPESAAPDS